MRRELLFSVFALSVCVPAAAQYHCGVARDLTVQAIENLKSSARERDIDDGIQLIKLAEQTCPTLGDVWYYRSLFEDELAKLLDPLGKSGEAKKHLAAAASALKVRSVDREMRWR